MGVLITRKWYDKRKGVMNGVEQSFAEKLKHYRKLKGWSQGELADKAGLSQAFISDLERGAKAPTLGTVRQIAQAFGIPVDMFVSDLYLPTQDLSLPDDIQKFLREQRYLPYLSLIDKATKADIRPEEIDAIIEAIVKVKQRKDKAE
jgi:transcriptional regulator with XRE-family HTH domain